MVRICDAFSEFRSKRGVEEDGAQHRREERRERAEEKLGEGVALHIECRREGGDVEDDRREDGDPTDETPRKDERPHQTAGVAAGVEGGKAVNRGQKNEGEAIDSRHVDEIRRGGAHPSRKKGECIAEKAEDKGETALCFPSAATK